MIAVLQNLKIFQPDRILEKSHIEIREDKILSISSDLESQAGNPMLDMSGYTAIPGYIDTHCHGAVGHDANDGTIPAIQKMNAYYQRHGITAYYPSLSVDPMPKLILAMKCIREAIRHNKPGIIEILGAHFESPFIHPKYKGAQSGECLQELNDENFKIIREYRDVIRRITLAPEIHANFSRIRELVNMNIVVSGGHSGASYKEVLSARHEGMTVITHLFNAMSGTQKKGPFREAGMLEAGLNMDDLYTEIIADRIHVPDELFQIAYKCKGADKICICSDANRAAGMKEGETIYTGGQEVIIENGIAMLKDRSSLASSVTALDKMVRNLIQYVGIDPPDAIKMASSNPAKMMHINDRKGSLEPGKDADINIVDKEFNIVMTFFRGIPGYVAEGYEDKWNINSTRN